MYRNSPQQEELSLECLVESEKNSVAGLQSDLVVVYLDRAKVTLWA
jgi:hypothetical protein